MNIKRPHDSFFKQLMSDPEAVKDFLKGFLPRSLSERIDYDSVRVIDTEKTDRKYRKFYLDLSVECRLYGQESEIYIVFEHKSYPDRFTLIQLLNYFSVVWEDNIKNKQRLKPIIPVVFYHGRTRFNLPREFSDYFEAEIIQKGEVKSTLTGSYMSYIAFDGKKWWDVRDNVEINVNNLINFL